MKVYCKGCVYCEYGEDCGYLQAMCVRPRKTFFSEDDTLSLSCNFRNVNNDCDWFKSRDWFKSQDDSLSGGQG